MKKLVLLILFLTFLISLNACDNERNGEGLINNEDTVLVSDTTQYYYPFESGSIVRSIVSLDNNILLLGTRGDELLLGIANYEIAEDGSVSISDTSMIDIGMTDAAIPVHGLAAGGDGNFYVLLSELSMDAAGVANSASNLNSECYCVIQKYSDSGMFLEQMIFENLYNDITGISIGYNGEIIIYGSSFVSLLHWNEDIVHTEVINGSRYVLSVVLNRNGFVASVHDFQSRITRFYLISTETGAFSEIISASMYDEGYKKEKRFLNPNTDKFFNFFNPIELVYNNEDGFNRLGIITRTQGHDYEYIVDDGFRFYTLWLDTGVYEKLYQWNYNLNDPYSCTSVSRLSESIFAYTVSTGDYLVISG